MTAFSIIPLVTMFRGLQFRKVPNLQLGMVFIHRGLEFRNVVTCSWECHWLSGWLTAGGCGKFCLYPDKHHHLPICPSALLPPYLPLLIFTLSHTQTLVHIYPCFFTPLLCCFLLTTAHSAHINYFSSHSFQLYIFVPAHLSLRPAAPCLPLFMFY